MSSGPKVQPDGAAVPARPVGRMALFVARNRQKSETPIPQVQMQDAPRFARRLLRLPVTAGGLRLSPSPS
eukprot:7686549-Alexandrium_andersonii.AAC.1